MPVSKGTKVLVYVITWFLPGVGHMILGEVRRGIKVLAIVLGIGFVVGLVSGFLLPFPYSLFVSLPVGIGLLVWAYRDLGKAIKRKEAAHPA